MRFVIRLVINTNYIRKYTDVLITVPIKPCPGTKQCTSVLVIVQTRAINV
jgi:hypothetical protein